MSPSTIKELSDKLMLGYSDAELYVSETTSRQRLALASALCEETAQFYAELGRQARSKALEDL